MGGLRRLSGALTAVLVGTIGMAVPAFTDDTGLGSTLAGDGSGEVSGFTVSAIHYEPSAADPGILHRVTFRFDPTPGPGVSVRVVLAGHSFACAMDGAVAACETSSPAVAIADITSFRVIAAD